MILLFLAALAAAPAASPTHAETLSSCGEGRGVEALTCRAVGYSGSGDYAAAAAAFEEAAVLLRSTTSGTSDPRVEQALAAAGNMWLAAGQPGKAALALDRALAGGSLQAEQRGEALLDRARAAEAQNDLKTARAKLNDAVATISEDPFYWYFSAALAIREENKETAQSAINKALSLAPSDPTILFEAGHVAHFVGDIPKARDYWTRAEQLDRAGPIGKAARDVLAMTPVPVTYKDSPATTQ